MAAGRFRQKGLHDRQDSISYEKVALSVMRSINSEVHAPGIYLDWTLFRHLRMTELGETCLNRKLFEIMKRRSSNRTPALAYYSMDFSDSAMSIFAIFRRRIRSVTTLNSSTSATVSRKLTGLMTHLKLTMST